MVEKIRIEKLDCFYDNLHVVKSLDLTVFENEILGIIGPANSGKTTFLRTLDRLNDQTPKFRKRGTIHLSGKDIYSMSTETLRKKIGMVFALPLPLPMSIYENIAFGPKQHGIRKKGALNDIVEKSLSSVALWDEVKDRLKSSAMKLSGGQQQRLCIARTLAISPEVILFDEPCSGLDPISTAKVEETMLKLKEKYTLVLVTNNVKQASRVGDRVAFFLMGELVELDTAHNIFISPRDKRTEDYVTGRFG
jgi:phosphate transport system ATP-binding protein